MTFRAIGCEIERHVIGYFLSLRHDLPPVHPRRFEQP
jgi:hypothetical protein